MSLPFPLSPDGVFLGAVWLTLSHIVAQPADDRRAGVLLRGSTRTL